MEDMVVDKKESKVGKLVDGFKSGVKKIANGIKNNVLPFAAGLAAGFVAGQFVDVKKIFDAAETAEEAEDAPFDEE